MAKTQRFLAIDTETTGGEFYVPYINDLTGKPFPNVCMPFIISTCNQKGESRLWHAPVDPWTRKAKWKRQDLKDFQELAADYPRLVFHNASFDVEALLQLKIDFTDRWDDIDDTLPMSHILDSGESHGLKNLAIKYLEMPDTDEDILKENVIKARRIAKRDGIPCGPGLRDDAGVYNDYWLPFHISGDESAQVYGKQDPIRTALLNILFQKELRKGGLWSRYQRERQMCRHSFNMKREGLPLRPTAVTKKRREYMRSKTKAESFLQKKFGARFNVRSPAQLSDALYGAESLGLPVVKYTPTRNRSCDAESLGLLDFMCATVAATGKVSHILSNELWGRGKARPGVRYATPTEKQWARMRSKILATILDYRKTNTNFTYLAGYEDKMVKEADRWVLHGGHNPWGTATTRFSSSNPNEYNVGKRDDAPLRSVFGPPPGWEMWCFDWQQLELRLMAHASKDPTLLRVLKEGLDMHQLTADTFSIHRGQGKSVNFAWQYGASASRLSRMVGTDATTFLEGMSRNYPGVVSFMKKTIRQSEKTGQVRTLFDYPLSVPRHEGYKGTNYIIQGTAGDLCKNSIIETDAKVVTKSEGRIRLVATIYDELIFLIKKGTPIELMQHIKSIMESAGTPIGVSTPVDVAVATEGSNWKNVKEVSL